MRMVERVGRLDQRVEHIQSSVLDAIPDREFVALGKFLDGRHKPHDETMVCLDCRAGARLELSVMGQPSPLDPRR
jgi:hypothetical protein